MIKKDSGGIQNHFKFTKTMCPHLQITKRHNKNQKKTWYLEKIKIKTQNPVN